MERLCFNTDFDEYGPRIINGKFYCLSASIDQKRVFVDENTLMPFSDLHFVDSCSLIRAFFSTSKLGNNTSMNSDLYDGPISGDSMLLFFTSNHGYEVNEKLGIFYALNSNNKWSDPYDFPFNSLQYNVTYPFYDPKSRNLYFSSDKGNVDGNLDIYVCEFNGKNFTKPKKVIEACSPLNDMSPFFYKNVLYFTSNGFNSIGGYDLFKVENNKTESLGELFNSVHDDLTLIFDTDSTGYFATNRFSSGLHDDIVKFNLYNSSIPNSNEISKVNSKDSILNQMKVSLQEDSVSSGMLITTLDFDKIGSNLNVITTPFLSSTFGELSLKPDGVYSYMPQPDFYGKDSAIIEICKEISTTARICHKKTLIFTVNAVNDAPIANADRFDTPINATLMMDVLLNDTSIDGELDKSTLKVSTAPLHGIATVDLNKGTINYVPNPGYQGEDNFTYQICDNGIPLPGLCSNGKVNVKVGNGIIAAMPKAEVKLDPMKVSINEDTKSKGNLITEADIVLLGSGISLKTAPFSPPKNGKISLKPDGTYSYIPRPNFVGTDSMVVKLCITSKSSVRKCHLKTLIFTVNAVNDAPVANIDHFETPINTAVSIDVLLNDTSFDGELDKSSLKVSTAPLHGSVTVDLNKGIITYVPNPGYLGEDNFRYEICDNGIPLPGVCSKGLVILKVGKNVIAELPGKKNSKSSTNLYPVGFEVGADLLKLLEVKNIYFDIDKSFIRPDAAKELDKIAITLKEYPNLKIQLISHTDCRMTEKYNMSLSKQRAINSKRYLVNSGIKASRILQLGIGESQLVTNCPCEGKVESTCTEEEHQLNRRTECIIIKL